MKKAEATNTFTDGLIMDFDPLVTPNTSLSSALNATFVTMNGKENVLQNDMGNCQIEGANLPAGYVPVGTAEMGGIIYIVSYNPLTNRSQIGSFPSPARNIFSETENINNVTLKENIFLTNTTEDFRKKSGREDLKDITNTAYRAKLTKETLHSGDKFYVTGNSIAANINYLSHWENNNYIPGYIKLSLGTLDSNNRFVYLNNLLKVPVYTDICKLDIRDSGNPYEDVYNTYNSKIAGELYLSAQLELIDSFDVTWDLVGITETEYTINFECTYTSEFPDIKLGSIDIIADKYYYKQLSESEQSQKSCTIQLTIDKSVSTFKITPIMPYGGRYIALTNTITIDTSLFGENILEVSKWRYYKDNSQMTLQFSLINYLSTAIDSVSIDLYSCNNLKKLEKTIEIPKRKSYSGNFTQIIPFSDTFKKNSLYLARVNVQYKSETNPIFIDKWLYTNGVFNSKWNTSELDFDQLYLPLTFNINDSSQIRITKTDDSKNEALFNNKDTSYIKGVTKYNIESAVTLNKVLSIDNDYQSFSTASKYEIKSDGGLIGAIKVKSDSLYNTGLEINDTINKYLNIDDNKQSINFKLEDNKLISDSFTIKNPIIADTALKTLQVTNTYHPICTTIQDYSDYNIQHNGDTFLMYNSFIGLGMSNGGTDNQGGGGIFYVQGETTLDVFNNNIVQSASSAYNASELSGTDGYTKLPAQALSNYISSQTESGIVPVLLVNAGTQGFYTNLQSTLGEDESGSPINYWKGTPHVFSDVQREKKSKKRVDWYQDKQASATRLLWLFMRNSDASTGVEYVPLSNFIRLSVKDNDIQCSIKGESTPLWKILASLLCQLYVSGTGETADVYTVNNFATYKKLAYNLEINLNISYKKPEVQIDEISLNELWETYATPCLSISWEGDEVETTKTVTIPIEIEQLYYDQYNQFYKGSKISNYVKSYMEGNPYIIPPTKKSGTLYYIDNGALKPLDSDFSQLIIVSPTWNKDTGEVTYSIPSNGLSIGLNDLSPLLMYGSRTKKLIATGYKKASTITALWGDKYKVSTETPATISSDLGDNGLRTQWRDARIFKDFEIN